MSLADRRLDATAFVYVAGYHPADSSTATLRCRDTMHCLTISLNMGSLGVLKTTFNIPNELLARARRYARKTSHQLRAIVEEGRRIVMSTTSTRNRYRLQDLSVGHASDSDPLEAYPWPDLREMMYGREDAR